MATSVSEDESITVLHESSGPSENNTLTEPVSRVKDKHTSRQWRRCKFRGIGSSSVLLILVWTVIIRCSLAIMLEHQRKDESSHFIAKIKEKDIILIAVLSLSLPLASLLGEVIISRYRLVSYTLRAMWILSLVDCIITTCSDSFNNQNISNLFYIQLILEVFLQSILLGAFIVSAVPLGVDQIITGTNENISAFVHWMSWAFIVGIATSNLLGQILYECTQYQVKELSMILSLVPVLLLSVGLILDFIFSHKLVQEPVTVNPVTLIFKVLKYAAKHKYPVRRSAFTYCDDQQPSRLDYGKSKYGGPFTTEQVEDVKTFWRILLVLLVISLFYLPLIAQYPITSHTPQNLDCAKGIIQRATDPYGFIIYWIPAYELLVYPCLRHRRPRILQSIGIGAAALIFSSLYGLTAETIQYYVSNGTTQCLFNYNESCYIPYIPFNCIVGIATVLLIMCSGEFVCAQAPHNMKGFLIGFYFITFAICVALGRLLNKVWKDKIEVLDHGRVGIWFYLTTLVLGVVSSVLLVCVIRWYKARERDEIANSRAMVEEIYYKYQQQETEKPARHLS